MASSNNCLSIVPHTWQVSNQGSCSQISAASHPWDKHRRATKAKRVHVTTTAPLSSSTTASGYAHAPMIPPLQAELDFTTGKCFEYFQHLSNHVLPALLLYFPSTVLGNVYGCLVPTAGVGPLARSLHPQDLRSRLQCCRR